MTWELVDKNCYFSNVTGTNFNFLSLGGSLVSFGAFSKNFPVLFFFFFFNLSR